VRAKPEGLPQAFLIAEDFIGGGNCGLILGDNILYTEGLGQRLQHVNQDIQGATVFGYAEANPRTTALLFSVRMASLPQLRKGC
jgi:glucose-1-phosphate thymidylyltransferase